MYVALDGTGRSRIVPRRVDNLGFQLRLGRFLSVIVYVSYSEIPPLLRHQTTPHVSQCIFSSLLAFLHLSDFVVPMFQAKLQLMAKPGTICELRHITGAAHLVWPHDCLTSPSPGSSSMTPTARHQLTLPHTLFVMRAILPFKIALRTGADDRPGVKDSCYTNMFRRSRLLGQSHGSALSR